MSELIMEVKPKYNNLVRIVSNNDYIFRITPIITLFFYIGCTFVFNLMFGTEEFIKVIENNEESLIIIAFGIFAITYILVSMIFLYLNKKNFKVTNYKVYADRIELEQGFINHYYTTLNMVDIKEIHLTQNFLQKKFGLGTIIFITAGNAENEKSRKLLNSGLAFIDIENPLAVYTKVRQIHENI